MTELGEPSSRTWVEIFPWITHRLGAAPSTLDPDSRPGDMDPAELSRLTKQLSTYIGMMLPDERLGFLFPRVPQDLPLSALPLSERIRNACTRVGKTFFGDIGDDTISAISLWRAIGTTSISDLINGIITWLLREEAGESGRELQPSFEVEAWLSGLGEDLATIARWNVILGRSNSSLLGEDDRLLDPPEVIDARERVLRLSPQDLGLRGGASSHEVLDGLLLKLDDRRLDILRRRVFADSPETLDSLGESQGVTRERIRQLESHAKAELVGAITSGPLGPLADAVRSQVSGLTTLERLIQTMPALKLTVMSAEQPVWRVLDRLDDSYEIRGKWCAAPSVEAAKRKTIMTVRAASEGAASLSAAQIESSLRSLSIGVELDEWLEFCGFEFLGDRILTGSGGIADRAEAILLSAGEPLEAEELLTRLGVERSMNSLKNALAVDARFDRVNRSAWALKEWGLDTYQSIRDLINRELVRSGGAVEIGELIDRITAQFSVSSRSVVAYAASPPFETAQGVVSHARVTTKGRLPSRTPRLFRRPDGWVYRTIVSEDHYRGSGSMLPTGIANALGLEFGEIREMPSRRGPQKIQWTSPQPTTGTVRRFVLDDPLAVGTTVFLCFGDAGTFDIEIATSPGDLMGAILGLAGQLRDQTLAPISQLAIAIGESPESGISDLITAFRVRGDYDIAELLEGA